MNCSNYIQHYDTDAELFDYFEESNGTAKDFDTRAKQLILNLCNAKLGETVLDIGSGSGWIARRLTHGGVCVTSVDLSLKNLARIRSSIHSEDIGRTGFVLGDALRIPFQDNSFDAVVASEVLEHLNVPASCVREFYRVVKPNGRVIISTPYKEKIQYYLCVHCNKKTPANAHLHSFDQENLVAFLKSADFKDVRFCTYGNKLFVFSRLSWLFRFLPFRIWRWVDALFCFIIRKPSHIALIGKKSA
jgi:ubiquinone/menaquinone biosynthesis C-methylase UbiE